MFILIFKGQNCHKLADVGNANTAYLDLSFLYGSDEETALNLRATNEGRGGVETGATVAITPFDHDKFYKLSA